MANNTLQAFDHQGTLVVDSRLIAQQLGIEHKSFMETIRKFQTQAGQAFGILPFQTGEIKGRGQPEKYALLSEDMATFYMSLSRNTAEVVQCKIELVKAFSKAKELLKAQQPRRGIGAYSQRVSEMFNSVTNMPADHWCVLEECSRLLIHVENLGFPVDKADLLDGSVGKCWSNYRKGKSWAKDRIEFTYKFPDGNTVYPWAYQNSELLEFRRWLKDDYQLNFLPGYLKRKYGALVKV